MRKSKNKMSRFLTIALSLLIVCSFSAEAYAQRSSRGGGASKPSRSSSRPASKPAAPRKSPSRSPSVSKPTSKPKSTASKPSSSSSRKSAVSQPTSRPKVTPKESSPTKVSKPSTPKQTPTAAPAKKNTVSSGRNSNFSAPTKPKTPISTALSGETRPRPPPSSNATSKGRNSSLSKTTSPKMSEADKALYSRAKQSGTVYQSREEAAKAFEKKYSSSFATTFKEEPKSRPKYIPPATENRPIVYSERYGGYGYWNGGGPNLGTFILYNALADAAVRDNLMVQKGYYYGPTPSSINGFSVVAIVFVAIVVICIVFGVFLKK